MEMNSRPEASVSIYYIKLYFEAGLSHAKKFKICLMTCGTCDWSLFIDVVPSNFNSNILDNWQGFWCNYCHFCMHAVRRALHQP